MSSFEDTRRIVTIVGICIGVLIGISVLATIIRCARRAGVAADFKAQNRRNAQAIEEQRRRQFVIDRGDLEYGLDTRAEAQASSYYGGMADVRHFGGNRTIQTTTPVQAGNRDSYMPSVSATASGERITSNPPRQPELSYHPSITRPLSNGATNQHQHGPVYDSPSELARIEDDVPPAYTSVISHR